MRWNGRIAGRDRRRRGMTLVEAMIACFLSAAVAASLSGLTVLGLQIQKSILSQQVSLARAKRALERLNQEIRVAVAPLRVVDSEGNPVPQGNRVEFRHPGDARNRAFELVSGDNDFATPWDNQLIYDPNTTQAGDEEVVTNWISPAAAAGAFAYQSALTPLVIRMRTGEPVGTANQAELKARTGAGLQGVEINITVAPRN
jgi:hypothetical protein